MDKTSENLELTNDPENKDQTSLSNQETKPESVAIKESHDSGNQEGSSTTVLPDKELNTQNYNPTVQDTPKKVSNTDHEKIIVTLRPEKGLNKLPLRRNVDNITPVAHSDEGVSVSKLPEKPTGDGYNWRKYGQKLVKGNTFVRSYYKCTFVTCPARKQVERSHDGNITEINYLWKHEHPKPPHTLVKGSAFVLREDAEVSDTVVPVSENSLEVAVSQSNDVRSEVNNDLSSDSKRQKREHCSINEGISTKTNSEPRVVVQTTSVVDIVNDGYRWRKYGQKLVKGNRNPRSYYRCTSAGCPAKKHVERSSHDEKVVITTYEGRHDHDMPAGGRTVSQNMPAGGSASVDNDGLITEPESSGMEMVLHVSAT